MKKLFYLVLALAVLAVWRDWSNRPLEHPPGVLIPSAPEQRAIASVEPFQQSGFTLTPRAEISLRARVLSRKDYRWGMEADLSPMDLALGWGVMSDQSVLDRIEVTQGGRWYFTRYDLPAPIPDSMIIGNSSNMHMVPADAWVSGKLRDIRQGDLLLLRGYLVDVDNPDGFQWRTSLRRDDTGDGSCEIFFLEYLEIADRH
jgi:hypothetical protein